MAVNDTNIIISAIQTSIGWLQVVVGGVFGLALVALIIRIVNDVRMRGMMKKVRKDLTDVKERLEEVEIKCAPKKKK